MSPSYRHCPTSAGQKKVLQVPRQRLFTLIREIYQLYRPVSQMNTSFTFTPHRRKSSTRARLFKVSSDYALNLSARASSSSVNQPSLQLPHVTCFPFCLQMDANQLSVPVHSITFSDAVRNSPSLCLEALKNKID